MWLSSAGIGELAPGKQVGKATMVPSFMKVPWTISSIKALASGERRLYRCFFCSFMAGCCSESSRGALLSFAGELESTPHPDREMGILFAPVGRHLDLENANGFHTNAAEEQVAVTVHCPA